MLPSSAAVKSTAKNSLKGVWPSAITVGVVLMLTYSFGLFLSELVKALTPFNDAVVSLVILGIFSMILFVPLCLGALRWFWCITAGKENDKKEIFIYFSSPKKYLRAVGYIISLLVRLLLCALIAFFPAIIASVLSRPWFYVAVDFSMPMWSANLPVIANFLEVLGLILFAFLALRLYLSGLLLVIDDEMHPGEAFHISSLISRDFLMNFILLSISFFGWFLLSLLAVPILFTLPLFLASFVVHGRFAINYYNTKVHRWQQSFFVAHKERV